MPASWSTSPLFPTGRFKRNRCGGHGLIAGSNTEIIERPRFRHFGDLPFDERREIVVIDKFLFVTDSL
jgi:hypothetical protein